MPYVKFNVFPSDALTAWGYAIEQTDEGVFGNVPDELVENELSAGRITLIAKKAKVIEPVQEPEVVEVQTPQEVMEFGSGKRAGRPVKGV